MEFAEPAEGLPRARRGAVPTTRRMFPMKRHPFTLVLDDGAPVNVMHFHDTEHPHGLLMSNDLAAQFVEVGAEHGVKGKFSIK